MGDVGAFVVGMRDVADWDSQRKIRQLCDKKYKPYGFLPNTGNNPILKQGEWIDGY
jgi:hypothetical protein